MQLTGADTRLLGCLGAASDWAGIKRLGVAVSGGGDSMAVLHLLAHLAAQKNVALEVATVDHGLRPEAAAEADFVAKVCAGLGLHHDILCWTGGAGKGNLQARARTGRYRLLATWAKQRSLGRVALGHTQDDQAETFLMRLKREAGVDGLASMEREFRRDGACFWRPALPLERQELRDFLNRHGLQWCEDPLNEDMRYDRVRARKALAVLGYLGIGRDVLSGVAQNMAFAGDALKQYTAETATKIMRQEGGDIVFDGPELTSCPDEIQRRLIIAALGWLAPGDYPPRRAAVAELRRAIFNHKPHTLRGCYVTSARNQVRFTREYNAVRDITCTPDQLWDGRWRLVGAEKGLEVRALGDAVKDCPDWREVGLPRASLMASPALWRGAILVAAPVAGLANGWSAEIIPEIAVSFTSVLSH